MKSWNLGWNLKSKIQNLKLIGVAEQESNPRPLELDSITLIRRPFQASGEKGCLALYL